MNVIQNIAFWVFNVIYFVRMWRIFTVYKLYKMYFEQHMKAIEDEIVEDKLNLLTVSDR